MSKQSNLYNLNKPKVTLTKDQQIQERLEKLKNIVAQIVIGNKALKVQVEERENLQNN